VNGRRALAACLGVALLPACETPPHEARLPLRLVVEPTGQIAPGDALRMTAWLHNPTRRTLRLEFDDQCQVELYVQGPERTVLHPPGGGASCVGAPSVLEVPPGDSVRFTGEWSATTSSLGEHIVYGVLWPHRVPRGDERVERRTRRSNVVVFYVLPGT
jgi:hypothetical protein